MMPEGWEGQGYNYTIGDRRNWRVFTLGVHLLSVGSLYFNGDTLENLKRCLQVGWDSSYEV